MYTNSTLISEVEKNQKLIKKGDVLFYVDASNAQKWKVTGLFKGGFKVKDEEGFEGVFFFNELQSGWHVSETTKKYNFLHYRLRYAS